MMLAAGVLNAQQPFVRFGSPVYDADDTLHWYTGAPARLRVFVGPRGARLSSPQNVGITSIDSNAGEFEVLLRNPRLGINHLCVISSAGRESASKCRVVLVEEPELKEGVDRWRGLHALIGRAYNPSSEWRNTSIPMEHYQTIVWFNNRLAFGRAGTSFTDLDLWSGMVVGEKTRDIETQVYWKPGGARYEEDWILLFSSQPNPDAVVPWGKGRVEIGYGPPEHVEGVEFEWTLDTSLSPVELEPILLRQSIGPDRFITPVPMEVSCRECAGSGISVRLLPGLGSSRLRLKVVDFTKIARVPGGKRIVVEIAMKGRGGTVGSGRVGITIQVPRSVASIFDGHAGPFPTAADLIGSQSGDADRAGIEAIRELPQFKGRTVNIYGVEGDVLQGIIVSIQAADSADYHALDSLGDRFIDESPPDFAARMIRLARQAGANFKWFTMQLPSTLHVDFEDMDVEMARRIFDLALSIIERERMRPTRFYLVASSEQKPKPLDLVGTKRDEAGNTIVVPTTEAGSMRAIFDGIEKKWFKRLEQSLAGKSSTRDAGRDAPLRQVWPEAPRGR